jgi:DNA repair exonuclease SbcCD ATPase subunit
LRRQHKELRQHMEAAGYDVEVKVTERSTEHLSSSEFQAKADRIRDEAAEVEAEKATYETLLVSLENRRVNLDGREAGIRNREFELAAARSEAQRVVDAAEVTQRSARASQLAAQRLLDEVERERDQLRKVSDRLQHIPSDIDRWLDKAKFAGKPAREYFNAAAASARASRSEVQRLIDGDLPMASRNPQREL